jgi:hypothetical protein
MGKSLVLLLLATWCLGFWFGALYLILKGLL